MRIISSTIEHLTFRDAMPILLLQIRKLKQREKHRIANHTKTETQLTSSAPPDSQRLRKQMRIQPVSRRGHDVPGQRVSERETERGMVTSGTIEIRA